MGRKAKQRQQSHGSAWHWKQTDCWDEFLGWAITQTLLRSTPPKVGDFKPDLPDALENLIDALLSKDPKDWPASAHAVMQSLQVLRSGEPVPALLTPRRSPLLIGVVAVVGLALLGMVIAAVLG